MQRMVADRNNEAWPEKRWLVVDRRGSGAWRGNRRERERRFSVGW